jgi:hypothetical protein
VPIEWWLSRICEEFHCLPSEALREWERAPEGLLETILEYRSFAHAKAAVDRAQSKADIPQTPMCDLVQEIEFDIAREELDGTTAGD